MNKLQYNELTTLGYEHEPIYASANAITGTRYITKLYLLQGSSRYPLGQFDGKLDEEVLKANFAELMTTHSNKQYGQQSTALLTRRNLTPVRERARGYGNISRDKRH